MMFLPANACVYCEFLSSEGISSSTKMLKGFATAGRQSTSPVQYVHNAKVPALPCLLQ